MFCFCDEQKHLKEKKTFFSIWNPWDLLFLPAVFWQIGSEDTSHEHDLKAHKKQ